MNKRYNLSEHLIAAVIIDMENGSMYKDIAAKYNLSKNAIQRIAAVRIENEIKAFQTIRKHKPVETIDERIEYLSNHRYHVLEFALTDPENSERLSNYAKDLQNEVDRLRNLN